MDRSLIGIFGGTFDPIHFGHLRLAEEMRELVGFSQIRFIPSGTPPHRNQPQTSAVGRSEMVKLALAARSDFVLDEREVRRVTPCYTVETLRELRQEYGVGQPLCLILGGDAFLKLHTWYCWRELFHLAHIVVGTRPSFELVKNLPQADLMLQAECAERMVGVAQLRQQAAGLITTVEIPPLAISATMIRERCQQGRSLSYLMPEQVINYIQEHKLYSYVNS